MKVIVSFTSYPPRINSVHKVVESLYRQTVQADEIILYLSIVEFPGMEADLPETLRRLIGKGGFRVQWVHGNLKSHKKYYYALQEYKDAVVITADDDKIYARTMIDDLVKSYKRFPDAVSARVARMMLRREEGLEPYSQWPKEGYIEECIDAPRMDLCAIGAGGICYPPSLAGEGWFDEKAIAEMAKDYDDLWLKYNEIKSGIPVVYTKPSHNDITIEDSQACRLAANNLYGNGNDQCIYGLFRLLEDRDGSIYQKYFRGLLDFEGYMFQKKRYYAGVYQAVFDRLGDVPIYFYGAGKVAGYILMILADLGLTQRITSIVVSGQPEDNSSLYGLQIRSLSELDPAKEFGVIFGVNKENRKEINDRLAGYRYQSIGLDMRIIARYYPVGSYYYVIRLIK